MYQGNHPSLASPPRTQPTIPPTNPMDFPAAYPAAGLHGFPTSPSPSAAPFAVSPTSPPLAVHVPATISGPVRARRRRYLLPLWQPATAHLKGSALVVQTPTVVLAALDVHDVVLLAYDRVLVRSEMPPASVQLRLPGNPRKWLAALEAAAAKRGPRLSDFEVVSPIGKGGGGAVFMVKEKGAHPQPLAMKVVQKHDAFHSDGSLRHALDERVVLELVRGFPFVVQLRHAFQTNTALYMVSDFCPGGNLRTLLTRQRKGRLSEEKARKLMSQIVLALEHVHSHNVIYRDLKPENVLLSADGDIRLCDFGLSKVLSTGRFGRTRSFCGSTSYMSPQVVSSKPYSIATDLWSLGALFYRILVGCAPFDQPSRSLGIRNDAADIQRRIQLGDVSFPSFLSSAAREMLDGLLRKNEEERMNLQDLKEALFFESVDWDKVLEDAFENTANKAERLMRESESLANFDPDRLRSHGVALQDKELRASPTPKKAEGEGGRIAFVTRQRSKLTAFTERKRSEMHRKPSVTSVVGFGFSSASASEKSSSVNHSDGDTSGSILDGRTVR